MCVCVCVCRCVCVYPMLLYQSNQNICFTYFVKFNTSFCISNIHFFNFSFSNLYFIRVDEKKVYSHWIVQLYHVFYVII